MRDIGNDDSGRLRQIVAAKCGHAVRPDEPRHARTGRTPPERVAFGQYRDFSAFRWTNVIAEAKSSVATCPPIPARYRRTKVLYPSLLISAAHGTPLLTESTKSGFGSVTNMAWSSHLHAPMKFRLHVAKLAERACTSSGENLKVSNALPIEIRSPFVSNIGTTGSPSDAIR